MSINLKMKSRKKVSLICIQGSFSGIFFQMLKEHFSLHSSFKEAFEKCMEFLPKETQTILELLSRKKNNLQNVIFATFFISFLKKIRMKSFGDFLKCIFNFFSKTHCLKITQNVAFEFLNFGIFHQFLSY